MADRYWVSGVQLGIIKGFLKERKLPTNIIDDEIANEQYIGRIEEWDKNDLEVGIKKKEGIVCPHCNGDGYSYNINNVEFLFCEECNNELLKQMIEQMEEENKLRGKNIDNG